MNYLVFAEPGNDRARWLQADALEQLGYQAESGPWRNFYLSAARELRQDGAVRFAVNTQSPDVISAMTSEMLFDFLAVRLDGHKAAASDLVLEIGFIDRDERWVLEVGDGVLHYREGQPAESPALVLESSRPDFLALISGQAGIARLVASGRVGLTGNPLALAEFGALFEEFPPGFEIVRP